MKKMIIYEPAMCCSTGICGVGVDSELLRISTVLNNLKNNGVIVERYNLSSAPNEFVKCKAMNDLLVESGVEALPVTVVDGEIVITGRYPSNEEFISLLNIPEGFLSVKGDKLAPKKSCRCGCEGGCS